MTPSQGIHPEAIIPNLRAVDKFDAIHQLVDKLLVGRPALPAHLSREVICGEILTRENMQTTGIGQGLAFPHARIEGWGEFALVLAISHDGIDFQSPDHFPARFIGLMISSPDKPYVILQTMAAILHFLNEHQWLDRLRDPSFSPQVMLDQMLLSDLKATEQILARDLARPVMNKVRLDTSIEETTRMMHLKQVDVLPVVDEHNKFRGEISCQEIFQYGLPSFFHQLNTVSFVRHIDPFERYFRIKRDLKVRDLLARQAPPINRMTTLLEIIFEMTVKKRSALFVVEDNGELVGVIDRFCIIDKILFF